MYLDPFQGAGFMFSVLPIFFTIFFAIVIGLMIWRVAQGARQWKRNNDSPVLTVEASIVAKRSDVSYHHNTAGTNHMQEFGYSATTYYVTFEVLSGDRTEFHVRDSEYGLLAEGDKGQLTFQGTRYLGFQRN
ncbi:hypothetical protein SDC9_126519 [bioreactor metagenome]|uniref:DUF2500 domain-containing protein n=1 Tax=bioreactor metagenome TaxID=1076179 RepID=A0A645CS03_9ZZZZ